MAKNVVFSKFGRSNFPCSILIHTNTNALKLKQGKNVGQFGGQLLNSTG